jgi:hypothetical protein
MNGLIMLPPFLARVSSQWFWEQSKLTPNLEATLGLIALGQCSMGLQIVAAVKLGDAMI